MHIENTCSILHTNKSMVRIKKQTMHGHNLQNINLQMVLLREKRWHKEGQLISHGT